MIKHHDLMAPNGTEVFTIVLHMVKIHRERV